MKVVLLERDDANKSPFRLILKKGGHELVPLGRGWNSPDPFIGEGVDLLVVDLDANLPDGRESKELLVDFRRIHPEAKIIAFTGSNSFVLEREIRRHGVISYMTKPLDVLSFEAMIDHIANIADRSRDLE